MKQHDDIVIVLLFITVISAAVAGIANLLQLAWIRHDVHTTRAAVMERCR